MLALMLDTRFKSLHLVSFFIGCDQGVTIVDQKVDDDNNLDIFQVTTRSTKPTKDLVKKELLVF